jgi:hypothetical protein
MDKRDYTDLILTKRLFCGVLKDTLGVNFAKRRESDDLAQLGLLSRRNEKHRYALRNLPMDRTAGLYSKASRVCRATGPR